MLTNSWIVSDRATGKGVCELTSPALVARVNLARYQVETAHAYLARLNRDLRAGLTWMYDTSTR